MTMALAELNKPICQSDAETFGKDLSAWFGRCNRSVFATLTR